MTKNIIDIKVDRSGFPVLIGGVELWVDDSHENLHKLVDIESVVEDPAKELEEKMKSINLPDFKETEAVSDGVKKSLKEVSDIDKAVVKLSYDTIFGEGSFDKLYKEIPDYKALEKAFNPVVKSVSERIVERSEEYKNEREKQLDGVKSEVINKKQQKKK